MALASTSADIDTEFKSAGQRSEFIIPTNRAVAGVKVAETERKFLLNKHIELNFCFRLADQILDGLLLHPAHFFFTPLIARPMMVRRLYRRAPYHSLAARRANNAKHN